MEPQWVLSFPNDVPSNAAPRLYDVDFVVLLPTSSRASANAAIRAVTGGTGFTAPLAQVRALHAPHWRTWRSSATHSREEER